MSKRIIVLLLCVCILFGGIVPGVDVEAKTEEILMETIDETPVRKEAKEKSEKYDVIKAGTLVTVVDCVKNSSGNYWYRICYGEKYAYVYSAHLAVHECEYNIDYSSEDEEILFCECGAASAESSGIQPASITGLALAGGGAVAVPGIGELILGGAVIVGSYYLLKHTVYFLVNAVGNIEIISMREAEDIQDEYSDNPEDEDTYHPAIILKEKDALLIIWSNEMDIDTAVEYLNLITTGNLNSKEIMTNVYTREEDDAERLAQYTVRKLPWKFQAYGNSRGFRMCEIDQKDGQPREGHYKHFHLFGWNDLKELPHIFFGEPAVPVGAQI